MVSAVFAAACWWIWFSLAVMGGIYEGIQGVHGHFSTLMQFNIIGQAQQDVLWFTFTFPTVNFGWFVALGHVMALNTALFDGWANWLRIGLPMALMFGLVVGILLTLFTAVLQRR